MVEPNARNSLVALVHRVVASVMGVIRGGPAPAPQDVDGGPRWNDASDSEDFGPRANSKSKSSTEVDEFWEFIQACAEFDKRVNAVLDRHIYAYFAKKQERP